ncbi:hypothetical protein [Microvirga sp. M2]|uniref:hypothetical protein n=1 Tax=Microvirga sp. M2 TaxID=3073270 RepID=UPI0039C319D5
MDTRPAGSGPRGSSFRVAQRRPGFLKAGNPTIIVKKVLGFHDYQGWFRVAARSTEQKVRTMARPISKNRADPFEGLQLPENAWKALESANIRSLSQMRAMAPHIEQTLRTDPETIRVIKDTLDRLAAGRILRVRLVFPKRSHPNWRAVR